MKSKTYGPDPKALVPTHNSGVRWETMNCYCCPPSVARSTAQIHNWFYNISDDGALWVNFYGSNKLSTTLADGSAIFLNQTTDYPWDGKIEIKIEKVSSKIIPIHFRIPDWTENPAITINGEKFKQNIKVGSYVEIARKWSEGDEIVLDFPMRVRLMEANPKVAKLNNKVAVMRGPIVYCLELPKQEGGEEIFKNGVFIPENILLKPEYRDDFLSGVTVLKGKALNQKEKDELVKKLPVDFNNENLIDWKENELYRPLEPKGVLSSFKGSVEIMLIPYYAWANRGLAYMDVWIPLVK